MATPYIHGQAVGTINWTSTGTAVAMTAEILDIKMSGIKREALDTTSMGTTGLAIAGGTLAQDTAGSASPVSGQALMKTFMPSAYVDPGEITLQVLLNPNVSPWIQNTAAWKEIVTIKLGPIPPSGSTQASWAGIAAMLEFDWDAPLDGKIMTATMKIKFSGALTITTAS